MAAQQIGDAMPALRLAALTGGAGVNVSDVLLGRRGAVFVFWSASCAHCVRYDSFFNTFAARYPELGFAAIASRINETTDQMISAVRERALSFPILRDEGAKLARLWYSQQTPRCYLLDAAGRLMYRGAIDNFKLPDDPEYLAYLEPAIAQFLNGEPVRRAETASFGCAIETVYYQLPKQL